ncbi:MAG: DJ-1/PfpI family protein [Rhodospirillaceae bacterium]|nr:DJ-1/PfpI family protein [Rhodospirillaceae bacterium]
MTLQVVLLAFPGVTQLDLTAPAQVFARLPDTQVAVASPGGAAVATDCGFSLLPSHGLDDAPAADLLCVPGGGGVADAIGDQRILDFIADQAGGAHYVTSVCTGAFLLGAVGLLYGRRATTHWGYTHLLEEVGAIYEDARVVVDGNLITGGGVTAGIDFALKVAAEVAGDETAQSIQLMLEYAPAPPFQAGHPSRAPMAVLQESKPRYAAAAGRMQAALEAVRERIG